MVKLVNLGIQIRLHIFFDLLEMIDNNLNLSICRVKVNCQIRKFKITKLKQQMMPTYCHIDSTDVIENDYMYKCTIGGHKKLGQTSNLYKVKIQKYTLCKFGFLQIRL
jgi:hypothetical protein